MKATQEILSSENILTLSLEKMISLKSFIWRLTTFRSEGAV